MEFQEAGQPGTNITITTYGKTGISMHVKEICQSTSATVVKLLRANLLLVLTATGPSILISGTLGNTTYPSGMA